MQEVEALERSVQEEVWGLMDRVNARDERVKALRQLLRDMQQLHCACQRLDSQQTAFQGAQARRLMLVAEESKLEASIDELLVQLQAHAREIGYNAVLNRL